MYAHVTYLHKGHCGRFGSNYLLSVINHLQELQVKAAVFLGLHDNSWAISANHDLEQQNKGNYTINGE